MKGFILLSLLWMQVTGSVLLFTGMLLISAYPKPVQSAGMNQNFSNTSVAITDAIASNDLSYSIDPADARIELVRQFILKYQTNSPLLPFTENIVAEADSHGIDYRLVPAIAMCESNLGIRIPSKDSYNAWGIAVYTGTQSGRKFSDWPEAIQWVSGYIQSYYQQGNKELKQIGAIWAPPSVLTGHSWANCVGLYRDQISL